MIVPLASSRRDYPSSSPMLDTKWQWPRCSYEWAILEEPYDVMTIDTKRLNFHELNEKRTLERLSDGETKITLGHTAPTTWTLEAEVQGAVGVFKCTDEGRRHLRVLIRKKGSPTLMVLTVGAKLSGCRNAEVVCSSMAGTDLAKFTTSVDSSGRDFVYNVEYLVQVPARTELKLVTHDGRLIKRADGSAKLSALFGLRVRRINGKRPPGPRVAAAVVPRPIGRYRPRSYRG